MKRLQVEVEPLSEERWARIERSLMARLPLADQPSLSTAPRAGRGRIEAVLGVIAVAATLAAVLIAEPWRSEPAGSDHPSRITTGESPSHLTLPGLTLDVDPESAVVMGSDAADGLLLVVDRGSIACRVAKRSVSDPLIVQAGGVRVRVVGTHFSVTRLGESARVQVFEGTVEVTFEGSTRRVEAGEEWSGAVATRSASDPIGPRMDGAPDMTASASAPELNGTAVSSVSAARDVANGSGLSASTPRSPAPNSANEAPSGLAEQGQERAPGGEPGQLNRPSSQALFEEATTLERTDPARASQLYAVLQSGNDSWAQNALYARGRLEATRGNRDLARRLLARYLERFPRGNNAEDARAVLDRLR